MRQTANQGPAQGARRGRARAAGEDVLAQAAPAFARAGFPDIGLVLRWADIAGPEVARVAQPVRLAEGPEGATLTLRCAPGSAVLLQHETRALIGRINAFLGRGRIVRLRLITGALAPPLPGPARHPLLGVPDAADAKPPTGLDEALGRLAKRRARGASNGGRD